MISDHATAKDIIDLFADIFDTMLPMVRRRLIIDLFFGAQSRWSI